MLSIEVSSIGSIPILQLSGRLSHQHVDQLRESVGREFRNGGVSLILETSAVTEVDIHGLRALHQALQHARRAGGAVILVNPSDILRERLAEARLDEILRIRDSLDEAAAAL